MQKIIRTYLLFCLTAFTHLTLSAQSDNDIWTPIQNQELGSKQVLSQKNMPHQFQAYQISNLEKLERILQAAPLRFSAEANQSDLEITLPMPDGSMERFKIFNFPVMQSRLAAAYPALRTFTAAGISNPTATAKIEMTPQGFSAMILGDDRGTIFITPFSVANKTYYSFYERDAQSTGEPFVCEVQDAQESVNQLPESDNFFLAGDCQLRQYRLALACTGEYAQFRDDGDDANGNIVADVMAAMVISMNRVNGVFEREVGVTMIIIDENTDIIFTDADNDPYTNEDANDMLSENVITCTNIIGSANYDIGHVLGEGGGGIAFINSPCTGNKARGVSKQRDQVDEFFNIAIILHEMGHQFGARHTQNNDCSRSSSASYEPGSGSTIMSYGGICPPLVQSIRDEYYHAISLEQMGTFLLNNGNSCPVILSSDNNQPAADAGSNYTIPISTPFVLTGIGTDADSDSLTYCWEQWDKEVAPMPPLSTSTEGPSFRSFLPSPDPERYFPRLSVLNGADLGPWEVLPSVSRILNFRLVVRDNNNAYGCNDESNMTVTVDSSAGPFTITNPSVYTAWNTGDTETITWDVANTDIAPIDCANVDIFYSTDGGFTYPNVIATNVPNNGSYSIIVPDETSSMIRFMVKCSDNIFFAISNENIGIGIGLTCIQLNSTDVPITISNSGTPTIISSLNFDIAENITDINVINLVGTHDYISDLRFKLISPLGTECILVDQRCFVNEDFDVTFDDTGNTLSCPFNDGQTARPIESLAIFNETSSEGTWMLEIADLANSDGGELLGWGLEICYEENLVSAIDDVRFGTNIELTPNPVNDNLTVSISSSNSFQGQLQVINTIGQTLDQVYFESNGSYRHQFQLAHLPAGVYFVRISDKAGYQTLEKFIKR